MGIGAVILVDDKAQGDLGNAALKLEVRERIDDMTEYRLHYAFDIAEGDFPLLQDARLAPGSKLGIAVEVDGALSCLVKGPVCSQAISFRHGGAGSLLEVVGYDSSVAMDRETKAAIWKDQSESDAVEAILKSGGFKPEVEPIMTSYSEDKHVLVQRDTDLAFVRRLARRRGCYFRVQCDDQGAETAFFGRPKLDAPPAADIDINVDPPHADGFSIQWDVERTTSVKAAQHDLNEKSPLDGSTTASPLSLLGATGLAGAAPQPRVALLAAAVDDAGDLSTRAEGLLIEAGFFIRAGCSVTTASLRKVVRVADIVNVQGVGKRHSGKYLCSAVHHVIDDTTHTMNLSLLRNAWGG